MIHRHILCALVVSVAVVAEAQFIGDTLAAAGFAETEAEFMEIAPALDKIRVYRAATHDLEDSTPPADVPAPRQPAPQPELEPLAPLPPMGDGPGAGFSGGGKVATAEEAAAWKAAYLPAGSRVPAPPAGSETVKGKWGTLEYANGLFFRHDKTDWVVVPAPVGATVRDRPAAASLISYNGQSYLYYNGAFFVWRKDRSLAEVVTPPAGAVVTNIPNTAKKVSREKNVCFEYNGTCFVPSFRGSSVVYVVG